jgi:endo-1,4-beta-xylanase
VLATLAGCGRAQRAAPDVEPMRGGPLHVGVSVQAGLLDDHGYAEAVGRLFDTVTPENELKWDAVEPDRDHYSFSAADRIVGFAAAHGERVRGHTLVWHNQLPSWLGPLGGHRVELERVLRDHIRTVVGRYRGRIAEWDVVNEAVSDSGGLRSDVWLDTLGPGYIALAFQAAHAADPGARLVYNDYGAEGRGPKADAVYALVKGLKAEGVPIDAVGFQTHVTVAPIPGFVENLRRFAALGVKVELTEVDVRLPDRPRATALARQAEAYRRIVEACRAVSACDEIVLWGLDDADSWVPGAYPGFGDATLLDAKLRPKPAYAAVREALLRGR